jgi:hypothetical protein
MSWGERTCRHFGHCQYNPTIHTCNRHCKDFEPDLTKPPCQECGAMTPEESESKCICAGDKDDCHGCHLWPD